MPSDFAGFESPDAATSLGAACDVFKQQGCPDKMHCTVGSVTGEAADVCVPNPVRSIELGGHCNPFGYGRGVVGDLCAPGLICAAVGDDTLCLKPCFLHTDCGDGEACVGDTGSPTTKTDPVFGELPLSGCFPSVDCDPITQAGCDDGLRCRYTRPDDTTRALTCKAGKAKGGSGAECTSSDQCNAGFLCTLGFCRRLCYFEPPAPDDGGVPYTCLPGEGQCSAIPRAGQDIGRCL